MKRESHGGRKIIPLSVEVGKEWKREGDEQCGNAEKVDETVVLSAGFWVT